MKGQWVREGSVQLDAKRKGFLGWSIQAQGRVPCGPWALCIVSQGCRVKVDEKEQKLQC